MSNLQHNPVLLNEVMKYFKTNGNMIFVDATFGRGGHSKEILKEMKKNDFLYVFDQDKDSFEFYLNDKYFSDKKNIQFINSNFINIKEKLEEQNIKEIDWILFDLGVSSPQLDNKERGFSYHYESKLDMRMDINNPLSAIEVVNQYSFEKLKSILKEYGEEKYARSIAQNIVSYRQNEKITTTNQLNEIITKSYPSRELRKGHPSRKTYQAIRIEVNNELEILESTLLKAINMLKIGGKILVITFHSLEDKIVKQIFNKTEKPNEWNKNMPMVEKNNNEDSKEFKVLTKKPICPSNKEIEDNYRSRSAKLRVIERRK